MKHSLKIFKTCSMVVSFQTSIQPMKWPNWGMHWDVPSREWSVALRQPRILMLSSLEMLKITCISVSVSLQSDRHSRTTASNTQLSLTIQQLIGLWAGQRKHFMKLQRNSLTKWVTSMEKRKELLLFVHMLIQPPFKVPLLWSKNWKECSTLHRRTILSFLRDTRRFSLKREIL